MRLAIVGAERNTRHLAPYDDPDYDILVFNEYALADWCKRWDICFQLHKPSVYTNLNNDKEPRHWAWLQEEHGKPIYMQSVDERVPDSVAYPLERIQSELLPTLTYKGVEQRYNFRATVAYAIAWGIMQVLDGVYEGIDLYGVELVYSAEYRSQMENFHFWSGLATGRQVPLNLECSRGAFNKPLYGFEEFMQEDLMQRQLEEVRRQKAEAKANLDMLTGAEQLLVQQLTMEREGNAEEATPAGSEDSE